MKRVMHLLIPSCSLSCVLAFAFGTFTFKPLPLFPNTYYTTATALNKISVVGYYSSFGGCFHGYQQIGNRLATVEPSGALCSSVEGINDHGVMVGGFCPTLIGCLDEEAQYGFMYDHGKIVKISYPVANASTVSNAINNLGQIVGGYCPGLYICAPSGSPSVHAFMLSGGVYTTLDYPGAVGTEAQGINDVGDIVGYYQVLSGSQHGYLYSKGVFTNLDPPGAQLTVARGINNSGTISGLYIDSTGITHGFTMQNGVYTMLSVPKSTSSAVLGINNMGAVVAVGVVHPTGPALPFIGRPAAASDPVENPAQ